MTQGQTKAPPRWVAFVARSTTLGLLVFALAVVPFRLWAGGDGVMALGLGGGLELVLIWVSYWLLRASFEKSPRAQFNAVLGGWLIRFGPTIAALFVILVWTDLPKVPTLVSVLGFYVVFLSYEVVVCWRSLPTHAKPARPSPDRSDPDPGHGSRVGG